MRAHKHVTAPALDRTTLTRLAILQLLFDGDPRAWLEYLETEGSPSQHRDDLPFVQELVQWHGNREKEA